MTFHRCQVMVVVPQGGAGGPPAPAGCEVQYSFTHQQSKHSMASSSNLFSMSFFCNPQLGFTLEKRYVLPTLQRVLDFLRALPVPPIRNSSRRLSVAVEEVRLREWEHRMHRIRRNLCLRYNILVIVEWLATQFFQAALRCGL